ncbi:MAG: nicotinamide riboside transporter PnuC [Bacteroidales bacterium]|jgi:nicotinamide mononucleotide transporter|nr:nicotinamide riboside transporter PnuC [Bacteroidales bacterium]MDD4385601.1 nicotinamide riboside transporter PnuC [Bacteroidales bacterium]MDY0196783.1 nicotinamide riboside transporter PnuC [Tenuifilaceae bacterium]
MIDWIQTHYIEIIGAITGLVFLYLEIKQNIWLWPVGIITSALYIYIFFDTKFYADMSLQFYYLAVSVYGWWHWLHGAGGKSEGIPIIRLKSGLAIILLAITVAIFVLLVYVLINFTDSPVPYGDAFTTALSITATWMLARKIIDMWWLWMIINAVSLGLYIYKGLYPTSVLFFFYFTMSIVGYLQWKKHYISTSTSTSTST